MSSRLRAIARDTTAIAQAGEYRAPGGARVRIADEVAAAVANTELHLPDDLLPPAPATDPTAADPTGTDPAAGDLTAAVEVTGESTLVATRRLGGSVACLVFASARNPGGGFLNGAQAQEESIARASALYPCLRAAGEFYAHHRAESSLLYTDRVIHSPAVPVFRDDGGTLLDRPYPVSFLTAAAPNRSAITRTQPGSADLITATLHRRATRVLAVAAAHGHRRLVLGAWGCGVFGNDPVEVADAFAAALRAVPRFEHVTFAVLGRGRTYDAFAAAFPA